ncbi:MAG: sigma-70 family RNA polymerase sigma factor [Kofleriaceae bacterium]
MAVNLGETELLIRLRSGDADAFEILVRRYHAPLARLARVFVSTEASAEEVVQDTWVAVLQGLDSFEERSSLGTWISRILVNRSKTKGVREARMTPFSAMGDGETDESAESVVDPARFDDRGMWSGPPERWEDETPEQLVGNQEAMALLDSELRQLPERQRVVVMLRDTLGWTAEDVCNALEINETNQRVLLHRARSRLRARLEQHLNKR